MASGQGAKRPDFSPYCNTGGYEFKKTSGCNNRVNVTNIDWLRLTITDLQDFEHTLSEIDAEGGILECASIETRWSEKGLHGYDKSAKLLIKRDRDTLTVGHIARSESGGNKGGLFELTGVGCKMLQLQKPELWLELYTLFQFYDWRISRADIALDLPGQYCLDNGYTVPVLFRDVVNDGLFRSDKLRNPNMKQTYSMVGDWSPLAVGGITPENYDPLTHCKAGLTAYVGSRKGSADFFRIYEKGKELLGAEAEPDSVDRAWVRVEHEMSRRGTGREIPLDVMLRSDEYFAIDRSGVRNLMDEYRESLDFNHVHQIQLEQFKREKSLSITKKVYWAKHSYGRLFRTLVDMGIDYPQIIGWLTRADGLKECIFDLYEVEGHSVTDDLVERGLVPLTATPDANSTRNAIRAKRAASIRFEAAKAAYANASGGAV